MRQERLWLAQVLRCSFRRFSRSCQVNFSTRSEATPSVHCTELFFAAYWLVVMRLREKPGLKGRSLVFTFPARQPGVAEVMVFTFP
jgi:hypothetical protein